jgi:lipopolysaccharide/colanic/teichoic acid biosynthesis glycosyltransferase
MMTGTMIRFFDLLLSLVALLILSPVLLIIALLIVFDSKGPVLFLQTRVGKGNKDFIMIKFRTMVPESEELGRLTIGNADQRITRVGKLLRRYKVDELPQLINILAGQISLVGPRPEVRDYVKHYTADQKRVLQVKPGLTDLASLEYLNENEILGNSPDPEKTYINEILPAKLALNQRFLNDPSLRNYFAIIGKTLKQIVR